MAKPTIKKPTSEKATTPEVKIDKAVVEGLDPNAEEETTEETEEGAEGVAELNEELGDEETKHEDTTEEEKPEKAPAEKKPEVQVDTTTIKEQNKPMENVKIRMAVDHSCVIAMERYELKAGKTYNVPRNVRNILNRNGLLKPL